MKFINKKNNKTAKTIGLHLIVWTALFFLNFLFLNNYQVPFDVIFHIMIWSAFIFLFYVNFLLLMPYLLFNRKIFLYILTSLFFIAGTFIIKNKFEMRHMDKVFKNDGHWQKFMKPTGEMLPFEKGLPPKDQMLPPPDGRMMRQHRDKIVHPPRLAFFSLYGILLVFTASTSLRLIQKWRDDEKRKTEIEKEKISTELTFLKHQVNPHFLFNALNNIYSLTINTSEKASNAILKLSSILRYILYETENNHVLLKNELNIVNDFIELQKIRITDIVKVTYKVTGDTDNLKIAPLLLIPLVENAFKFGVDNVNESFIEILVNIQSFKLEFSARNRIVQINPIIKNDTGIGIKNIKRRLDILYPGKYLFITENKDAIFVVKLNIDLT